MGAHLHFTALRTVMNTFHINKNVTIAAKVMLLGAC